MTTVGFSMELESGALTMISGMAAMAVCRHEGAVLVSDGRRLFRVGGPDDDGAPIAARVGLPASDCGEASPKRLITVGLEGVAGDGMTVTAASDSGARLAGVAGPAGDAAMPGRAEARMGRGHGRVWQVALAAQHGEAFDLRAIVLETVSLDRRRP